MEDSIDHALGRSLQLDIHGETPLCVENMTQDQRALAGPCDNSLNSIIH